MKKPVKVTKSILSIEVIYKVILRVQDHDTNERVYVDNILQERVEGENPYPGISPFKPFAITWNDVVYYVIDNGVGYLVTVYR